MTKLINEVKLKDFTIANNQPFTLLAGPCQLENEKHSFMMAEKLKNICDKLGINFIFKSSFDKANRSSATSKRGVGLDTAMNIFASLKKDLGIAIVTDVHTEEQCEKVAEHVDVLQIPALLSRQTDLLKAAASTGKIVNVKKGQFMAPWDVKNVVGKLEHFDNKNILLTERGAMFGYNNLVSDMRSLKIMAETGYPVIFDATHSVQQPGSLGKASGGDREFVETLARAAIATGVAGLFMETHQDPDTAPSDGPCMFMLHKMEELLTMLKEIDNIAKKRDFS